MIEKPYEGRAKIKFDGSGLFIKIPSRKNWFLILFSAAWLGGWFMGEISVTNQLISGDNNGAGLFMLLWLVGWTIGGIFVISLLIWSLFGQEKIAIDRGILSISKGILDIDLFKKNYDLTNVKNLELNPDSSETNRFFGKNRKASEFYGLTGGKMRFDYGMKTIQVGIGIDEAEARFLIEEIMKRGFIKDN